jgi:SPOR domain
MSVSGSRSAEINLDEFERRLRAAGAQPAGLEDPLFELARLVEGSWPEPANAPSSALASGLDVERPQQLETGVLRPELEGLDDFHDETVGSSQTSDVEHLVDVHDARSPEPVQKRRSRGWTLRVAALAVVGLAMIGAVFALRGGVPGLPKQPPFIAAAQGPTKVQPPSEETVAAANDAGANLLKDSAQPEHVKVVASEEQPVDLNAQGTPAAALANAPTPPADPGASGASLMKGIGDAPVVVTLPAGQPPVAQQFPDPKPVRTVSLRPDGTPIPPSMAATAERTDAAPLSEAPKPLAKPATKPVAESVGSAQPSTPKLDVPTKLSGKSSARVAVAKTDTTASGVATAIQNDTVQSGAPTKPEKPPKAPKIQQAAADTGSPAAPTQPAAEAPSTASSAGWAVQLAAPKSEAEAKSTAARLSSKYESALNGSAIGMHKAVVNGETIYRLRVVGLSKADAAALCARLKGDGGDCFIAK